MKKIFLINFSSPILIEVAKNLKQKGIEIVYWQGYRADFESFRHDKKNFPNTIFHHAFDAIKNIPPKGVNVSSFEPISQELVEELYSCGWQAISMIGRVNYTDSPIVKKRNIYYQYIKFWYNMLKNYKPDAILFTAIPHSATSYTLFSLAKILKVETIMIEPLTIETRALVLKDYEKGHKEIEDELIKSKGINYCINDLDIDLKEYYLKQIDPEIDSTPNYKKRFAKTKKPYGLPNLNTILKHLINLTIFKVTKNYLKMMFGKRRLWFIDQDISGLRFKLILMKRNRINKKLKKEYLKHQVKPNLNKKFIYIPLNFQPELTTCPKGGVFDDQMLMIDTISSCLPNDWVIYVKEHGSQWRAVNFESYLYRYEGYYEQISKFKNTFLIPSEISTFDLIENCQVVATVTSTAGWEAILRSKPVLVFGYVWYTACEGVERITNLSSCKKAIQKITDVYKIDKQRIINFLVALDKVSVKTKDYKTKCYKEDKYVSREDNVRNLTNAFCKALKI